MKRMEFSVESSIDYVYDKKTKNIFREVISCYINQNYRSTIVMLYTVTICDLIYKLQEIRDIYQDEKAKTILADIEQEQNKNPTSPRWEDTLIKRIGAETELLSSVEIDNIKQLKNLRNLSAHPVLNSTDILYAPSREMTLAQIRGIAESILFKPPLLSKRIIESFLEDIESNKSYFLNERKICDTKSFRAFLKIRYYRFMGNTLKKYLFKTLWKFVFITDNVDCDRNRYINFYALDCLYWEFTDILKEYVKDEQKFFLLSKNYMIMMYEFLIKHPDLYLCLQEDVKIEIKKAYDNTMIEAKILGVFLSKNIEEHCDKLEAVYKGFTYNGNDIEKYLELLYEYGDSICKGFVILRCFINIFAQSFSYQDAGTRFKLFILPYLSYMENEEFIKLIDIIKTNSQIRESYEIAKGFSIINAYAKKFLGEDFSVEMNLKSTQEIAFKV